MRTTIFFCLYILIVNTTVCCLHKQNIKSNSCSIWASKELKVNTINHERCGVNAILIKDTLLIVFFKKIKKDL